MKLLKKYMDCKHQVKADQYRIKTKHNPLLCLRLNNRLRFGLKNKTIDKNLISYFKTNNNLPV